MVNVFKSSLRYRLLLFFVVLAMIPLGVSSWNMITITQDELKSAANDEISSTAGQIADEIDNTYLNIWAAPLLLVKNAIDNPDLGPDEKMAILALGVQEVPDIVAFQLDVEGFPRPFLVIQDDFEQTITASGYDANEVLTIPSDIVRDRAEPGELVVGDLEYFEEIDVWATSLSIPLSEKFIVQSGGNTYALSAILTARISLQHLRNYIETHPFASTNDITVIDSKGSSLLSKGVSQLERTVLTEEAVKLLNSGSRAVGVHHYTKENGDEILGAYALPTHLDLSILVEKNKKIAYLAVSKMRKSLVWYILLGLSIAVITAIIVSYSLTKPLAKLTGAAKVLSGGDFSVRIEGKERADEIGQLSQTFTKMVSELKHYIEALTETTKLKERAESELRLARDIQQSFIPHEFPELDSLDFYGRCDPAREVGGDFFDYVKIDDHRYGFVIGDVSGKGVPAALFMAMSRALFYMLSFTESSPQAVLENLNRYLIELDPSGNMFITIFYGIIDCQKKSLLYSSAGHNMPFVKLASIDSDKFTMFPRMKTMVAGMMDDIILGTAEVELSEGDIIALYTDGMTEAMDAANNDYGEDGMMNLLDENADFTAQQICDTSIEVVKKFQEGVPQFDDMTMLVIRIKKVGGMC